MVQNAATLWLKSHDMELRLAIRPSSISRQRRRDARRRRCVSQRRRNSCSFANRRSVQCDNLCRWRVSDITIDGIASSPLRLRRMRRRFSEGWPRYLSLFKAPNQGGVPRRLHYRHEERYSAKPLQHSRETTLSGPHRPWHEPSYLVEGIESSP